MTKTKTTSKTNKYKLEQMIKPKYIRVKLSNKTKNKR